MMLYVGAPLALLGLAMMTRGWIYTLRPNGPIAEKRKKKNLQRGFTTDMKLFGRKVRRLGLMLVLAGGVCVGWQLSHRADAAEATVPTAADPTTPTPPTPPTPTTTPTTPMPTTPTPPTPPPG